MFNKEFLLSKTISTPPQSPSNDGLTKSKTEKRHMDLSIYKWQWIQCYLCDQMRVLIGFSFNPMLSGERSSGAIHVGQSGLLGLPLKWFGLCIPYPRRKYSMGTNIAYGCSSVTTDPQAWTCVVALFHYRTVFEPFTSINIQDASLYNRDKDDDIHINTLLM